MRRFFNNSTTNQQLSLGMPHICTQEYNAFLVQYSNLVRMLTKLAEGEKSVKGEKSVICLFVTRFLLAVTTNNPDKSLIIDCVFSLFEFADKEISALAPTIQKKELQNSLNASKKTFSTFICTLDEALVKRESPKNN